jgi:hypothetical protein
MLHHNQSRSMRWAGHVVRMGSLAVYFTTLSQQLNCSVDDRVTNEWWWIDKTNIHALSGIQTHGIRVKAIESYASERAATGLAARMGEERNAYKILVGNREGKSY